MEDGRIAALTSGVAANVYGSVVLLVNPSVKVQRYGPRYNYCQLVVPMIQKMSVGTLSGTHPWLVHFQAPAFLTTLTSLTTDYPQQ